MITEEENNELEKEYLETFNEKKKQAYLIRLHWMGLYKLQKDGRKCLVSA